MSDEVQAEPDELEADDEPAEDQGEYDPDNCDPVVWAKVEAFSDRGRCYLLNGLADFIRACSEARGSLDQADIDSAIEAAARAGQRLAGTIRPHHDEVSP